MGDRKLFGDNVDNSEKRGEECMKMAQIRRFLKIKKEKVIPIFIPKGVGDKLGIMWITRLRLT